MKTILTALAAAGIGLWSPLPFQTPNSKLQTPTFAKDVAPILYKHCSGCHRPGEVAPFSLMSYEDAKKRAAMIAKFTKARAMPPWKAVHGYNQFLDENRLTDTQIATLKAWADAGAPRGDAKSEPLAPTFGSEWNLGKPTTVIQPPKAFTLAAEGDDVYRNFVIKTDFKETRWITAMDVKPGNPRIVHHVICFLDGKGAATKLEEKTKDGQPGYSTFGGIGFIPDGALGGWAPGLRARHAPEGTAFELKPGTSIVIQVHYHKSGKAESDQTKVALYFADKTPAKAIDLAWIANPFFRIPPGEKNHKVEFSFPIRANVTAYGAMPHMHLLGKSMKAWVELPDGTTKPIVFVDDWDFNWQMTYAFKEPLKIPKGSKIRVEAYYDNSSENPNNPRAKPQEVRWGEQTTDEMFLLIVAYAVGW